ncbi:MAG: hypothetical protein O7G29_05805 [Acidobacteria bacterium]|nr:hypothetical protein [Acidobacteriota bacterium]
MRFEARLQIDAPQKRVKEFSQPGQERATRIETLSPILPEVSG